jgi:hypothetical protein
MLDFGAKAAVMLPAFEGETPIDEGDFDSFQGVFE